MKKLLVWILTLSIVIGLLPVSVIAAELQSWTLNGMQVEQATVEVEYKDEERSAATITYHKEGLPADSVNLIFLVDTSVQGTDSSGIFRQMMIDSGTGYIFDYDYYDASTTVQLITYENTADTGSVYSAGNSWSKDYWSSEISGFRSGAGTANEAAALDAAIAAVQSAHSRNGNPTVVFWVLGEKIVQSAETIEPKLQALKSELENKDGALVTWQYAAQPNALLAEYATHHSEAHDDPSEPKQPAAHASDNRVLMQEEMSAGLEELVHDHYHNIHFSLVLDDGQSLVTEITDVRYEASSSMASLTAIPRADGKGLDVTIERQCRQIELDFIIEVELDTSVYEKQTVIPAGAIIADHNGTNGGLHTGLFDEQIEYGLELDLPAAEVDRTAHDITFLRDIEGVSGMDTVEDITDKIVGQTIILPTGGELLRRAHPLAAGLWSPAKTRAATMTPGRSSPCHPATWCWSRPSAMWRWIWRSTTPRGRSRKSATG